MIWQPGQLLRNGTYKIDRELGRGGFGITYLARHTALECPMVIKSPHTHLSSEPTHTAYVDRFTKEGRNLKDLSKAQHPNIVRVADFFDEGAVPCMVMDYVEGETLSDRVQQLGAIDEAIIVPCIVTIAEVLAKVHELNLVHQDANPANIIIQPDGQPMLIDFGIALEIQPRRTTTMAAFGGHRDFAPYEQLSKKQDSRDPRVDIYCLGATLYFTITGEYPDSAYDRKIAVQEGKDCLVEPQTIVPTISDRINHAILSAMEMDPNDRPTSMKEWITLLTTDDGLLSKITAPTLEELPIAPLEFTTIEVNEKAEIIAEPKCSAQSFDENLNEGLNLKMIVIFGGSFMIGSPEDELDSDKDEKPQNSVTVPSFTIAQTPVTQAQWKAISNLPKVKLKLDPEPSFYSGDDRPVERVNWFEAVEFCDRLTRLTQRPYRLPNEAEWEYACRSGTTTAFNIGSTIATDFANYRGVDDVRSDVTYFGNYGDGSKGLYRGQTLDVSSFPPNRNGLYDMHGNIWEWCSDHWHSGHENAPIDGSTWLDKDADDNSDRIIRGGSWYNTPHSCRSAFRNFDAPVFRDSTLGFRVVFPLASRILV